MKLDELKKGLWGYQKASVYAYISMTEEQFSAKLAETESQYKEGERQYQTRIEELERELAAVRKQLDQQQSEKLEIATTLIEATQYGTAMRREAEEKSKKEREAWEEQLSAAQKELEKYRSQISTVRELLQTFLQGTEEQAGEMEQQVERVQSDCPSHNMILFERKQESQA